MSSFVGWLFPLVAIAGIVGALAIAFGSNHGGTRRPAGHGCSHAAAPCSPGAPPAQTPVEQTQSESARAAFRSCLQQAGVGGGGGFGRGGPSSGKVSEAFAVCSSLLKGAGAGGPAAPATPTSTSPPVA
jgi:hypothetical protein